MFRHVSDYLDINHSTEFLESTYDNGFPNRMFYEIILFVKGDVEFQIESEKRKLMKGDIIFLKPGEQHNITVNKEKECEIFELKFSEKFIEKKFIERINRCLHFFPNNIFFESLITQLDYYHKAFDSEDFDYYCRCKIPEILLFLIKASELSEPSNDESKQQMLEITNYIKEHLKEDISVSDIARHMKLSESYVRYIFKENMKIPIMMYIRSKKIILARSMIMSGIRPGDAAKQLNFADYSTFYRAYTKVTGNTPNEDSEKNCG